MIKIYQKIFKLQSLRIMIKKNIQKLTFSIIIPYNFSKRFSIPQNSKRFLTPYKKKPNTEFIIHRTLTKPITSNLTHKPHKKNLNNHIESAPPIPPLRLRIERIWADFHLFCGQTARIRPANHKVSTMTVNNYCWCLTLRIIID